MRRAQGFTLIELLLAVLIGMVLLNVVFGLMTSSRRLAVTTVRQANSTETLQVVAATIGDDVRRSAMILPTLSVPSWALATAATSALNLSLPADSFCASAYDVSYYIIPRDNLTGSSVSEWLRLPADTSNSTRSVLIRATQCGSVLVSRLVADYLDAPQFAIAQVGSSSFTSAPTSATGGLPFLSARTSLASAVTDSQGTTRVPTTGYVMSVATSRTIDLPP